jgi:hypothetical protein
MINRNPKFPANKAVAQGARRTAQGKIYLMPGISNFTSIEKFSIW